MDLIKIAKEMEALAQTGLHYSKDQFDTERYSRLRELSAEILAGSSNLSAVEILNWNKAEFGYTTPKVDVRGFILRENKVLLIREDMDQGRWTLPGGWADVNETPSESVVREVEEESGKNLGRRACVGDDDVLGSIVLVGNMVVDIQRHFREELV